MEKSLLIQDVSESENTIVLEEDSLSNRIKKSLYYAPHKNPMKDTLSFPITRDAVEKFRKAAPSSFGKLGHRYAARVARDACVSPCSLILGIIYIERLANYNPDYLQRIPSSELFLISMMIASKYLHDEGVEDEVFNEEWAASGLVDVEHINELEAEFLQAIDWHLFVRQREFLRMLYDMEKQVAVNETVSRGWCSYTDCFCLLQSSDVLQRLIIHAELLCEFLCACLLAYVGLILVSAASLATLQASTSIKIFPVNQSLSVHDNLPQVVVPVLSVVSDDERRSNVASNFIKSKFVDTEVFSGSVGISHRCHGNLKMQPKNNIIGKNKFQNKNQSKLETDFTSNWTESSFNTLWLQQRKKPHFSVGHGLANFDEHYEAIIHSVK